MQPAGHWSLLIFFVHKKLHSQATVHYIPTIRQTKNNVKHNFQNENEKGGQAWAKESCFLHT